MSGFNTSALWLLPSRQLCCQQVLPLLPHTPTPAAATLASFLIALAFFIPEVVIYKTCSPRKAISPLVVASELHPLTHHACCCSFRGCCPCLPQYLPSFPS